MGLATPTWDRLFDKGYITFKDNGELICGTQISNYTWSKLKINPSSTNKFNFNSSGKRSKYLKYHRENIFLDRRAFKIKHLLPKLNFSKFT